MTTKKPREFWVDPNQWCDDADTLDCFQSKPIQGPIQWQESLIHVREVLPEPTDYIIDQLGRQTYDESLQRYHEKPDFSDAYLMGFRAALAWMKGEK